MHGLKLIAEVESYDTAARAWLGAYGRHYLNNPPPSCLFAIVVREAVPGLGMWIGGGHRLGLCLVGRPEAPALPQDGVTLAEVTRMVLVHRWHGAASWLLRRAFDVAASRRILSVISYHDRTRHTGTIYRKAGMRKDPVITKRRGTGWESRPGRVASDGAPKRRWRIDLVGRVPSEPFTFDVIAPEDRL